MNDEKLKIAFDDPEHGWIGMTITHGDQSLMIIASYISSDSLLDLTNALHSMIQYDGEVTVTWHREPVESVLRFSRKNQTIRLEIVEYPDHRRIITSGKPVLALPGLSPFRFPSGSIVVCDALSSSAPIMEAPTGVLAPPGRVSLSNDSSSDPDRLSHLGRVTLTTLPSNMRFAHYTQPVQFPPGAVASQMC